MKLVVHSWSGQISVSVLFLEINVVVILHCMAVL